MQKHEPKDRRDDRQKQAGHSPSTKPEAPFNKGEQNEIREQDDSQFDSRKQREMNVAKDSQNKDQDQKRKIS